MVVTIPDAVSDLVERLATERGQSFDQVLIEAVQQFAGRNPELVARVTRSIKRHHTILERLART